MLQLPEEIKVVSKDGNKAVLEIGPLMPGYGPTIANPLRRVLLSSLEGAAITSIKIKGVDHEFSSVPGVLEDVMQLILNIKKIRFKSFSSEPVVLTLQAKKEGAVTSSEIKLTSDVELVNPDQHIATLTDKKIEFQIEMTVEKGVGYVPVEQRQKDKLPIGVIAIDAIFSPVKSVNFTVEDIRVGQRIDYNKVLLELETDGSLEPELAIKQASDILINHFSVISQIKIPEATAKPKTKKSKKSKEE